MSLPVIAILMPGDMGSGVGAALSGAGHEVVTCLTGRSDASRALAAKAGMQDVQSLVKLVERADIILSILPPSAAVSLARDIATAHGGGRQDTGLRGLQRHLSGNRA